MKIYREPTNIKQWDEFYNQLYSEVEAFEQVDGIVIDAIDEVVAQREINVARSQRERSRKEIGDLSLRSVMLYNSAKRRHKLTKAIYTKRAALTMITKYPNVSDRESYAEERASSWDERKNNADILKVVIHDERSRLWQQKEYLDNLEKQLRDEMWAARKG